MAEHIAVISQRSGEALALFPAGTAEGMLTEEAIENACNYTATETRQQRDDMRLAVVRTSVVRLLGNTPPAPKRGPGLLVLSLREGESVKIVTGVEEIGSVRLMRDGIKLRVGFCFDPTTYKIVGPSMQNDIAKGRVQSPEP